MRCVSYTRTVSCMESGEIPKDIISQQNQRIQDYIKKRGWTLGKKYSDRRKDAFEETAYLQMKMRANGIGKRTVEQAKKDMGIISYKLGDKWYWQLNGSDASGERI